MRKSRYTGSQIMAIRKQAEVGRPVPELCREHGMSSASIDKWPASFGDRSRLLQDNFGQRVHMGTVSYHGHSRH